MRKFIIPFDSGIVVIKHWRIHNYIQKDRYTETKYKEELSLLRLDENNSYTTGNGTPIDEYTKEKKKLTAAQQKRLAAKKESSLPYSFEYKIRNAFVGKKCPICGCTMSYENDLVKPTIQHNVPISKGGKHEIDNISVICMSCNTSIQNREFTPPYNTEEVKKTWELLENVSGMDTQDSIGKYSIDKNSIDTCSSNGSKNFEECTDEFVEDIKQPEKLTFDDWYKHYPKKQAKRDAEKAWKALKPNQELIQQMIDAVETMKTKDSWTKDNGQFIPLPATWIRGGRWEDEEAQPPKTVSYELTNIGGDSVEENAMRDKIIVRRTVK